MAKAGFLSYLCLLGALLLVGCNSQSTQTMPVVNDLSSQTLQTTVVETSTSTKIVTLSPPTTSTPSPTDTTTPTQTSRLRLQLVFQDELDKRGRVYALPVNCLEEDSPCVGKPELLFEYGSRISSMQWSRDGNEAVLAALDESGERDDIFVINAKGKMVKRVTRTPSFEGSPTWLPDGKHITYIACNDGPYDDGKCKYIKVGLDGDESSLLLNIDDLYVRMLAWAPDGKKLAFDATIQEPFTGIFVANPDGSDLLRLTSTGYYNQRTPVFSPDGEWIAFIRYFDPGDYSSDIYKFHPDGTGEVNLTNGLNPFQVNLAWSPIGDWIAFNGCQSYVRCDLYIIKSDGSVNINLSHGEDWELLGWRAFWSP